ncbi:MAG: ATP-binding cassette domain-containing protein, partial [Alphaproteobacteria bacterium]|nr:ATP-binding cassette domain-containing protein [Alphaproteobacteria bacterium]
MVRIEARSLIVRYGKTFAVAGASAEVEPGTVLAVVGPNGSGKSSLVKAIAGLVPASGEILFGGRPERPARIG